MQRRMRTIIFDYDTLEMLFCGVVSNINEAFARVENKAVYSNKVEVINNENHAKVTYIDGKTRKFIVKVESL